MKSKKMALLYANQMSAAEVEQVLRRMIAYTNQTNETMEKLSGLQQPQRKVVGSQEIILAIQDGDTDYTLVRTTTKLPNTHHLSQREQEIARLIAAGCSDKMVAQRLAISVCTVNTYVRRIFAKLAVNSRAEMVAQLLAIGLL